MFRPSDKQNKKLTALVVIGSDFQKMLAHLPFGATRISAGRRINLSFAERSQLKMPINERLNFILFAPVKIIIWARQRDEGDDWRARRLPSRGNECHLDRIAFGSRYPSHSALRLAVRTRR
ncbi:unnamed protein product [Danaus chrysippus]|nr:unnamed protein product [Danaus chrysippus]